MPFCDKLNALMNVQNVSNSRLAKALTVDASLVSRWRNGARVPPKNSDHIKSIASYFATHAKMDYQKVALYEIMGLTYDKTREEISFLYDYLYNWLCGEASPDTQFVDGFINKFTLFGKSKISLPEIDESTLYPSGIPLSAEVFYGTEGKRQGVLRFLAAVAFRKNPCTMLLYSDESMEWLTEDKAFYVKWGVMLMDVLAKGHKIKIIHTINRDLSEMLSAIERWLPLYMTGAIEPYYYPKYREHIFRRTIFIAPDVAALTSSTLSEHSKNAEQIFCTDPNRIAALVDEFNSYLQLCRPLMQIFNRNNIHKFCDLQLEFEEQPGNCFNLSSHLSSATMSHELLEKILDQSKVNKKLKEKLLSKHEQRRKAFETNLKQNSFTDIIALPSPCDFAGQVPLFKPIDFFGEAALYYTPLDYIDHMNDALNLMEKCKNYSLIISSQSFPPNIFIALKEDVGVIVAKNDTAPMIFAFNQQNMIHAFHSYIEDIIKAIPKKERSRKHTVKMLYELSTQLRDNPGNN